MEREEYRHELKFFCSEAELHLIENRIRHVCMQDAHVDETGIYRIKSLYFDTPEDSCLMENLSGVDNRHKYRIRIYNDSLDVIKLERKSSLRGLKKKDACRITKSQCEQIIHNREVTEVGDDQAVLREFLLEQKLTWLAPKVVVEYRRTPYVYPIGNVRITFDRDITSSDGRDFLKTEQPRRCIMPFDRHILEVKYDDILPSAILELVNGSLDLQRTSFSKYALCREYSIR